MERIFKERLNTSITLMNCLQCNQDLSSLNKINSEFNFNDKLELINISTYKCPKCNYITYAKTTYKHYKLQETKYYGD